MNEEQMVEHMRRLREQHKEIQRLAKELSITLWKMQRGTYTPRELELFERSLDE